MASRGRHIAAVLGRHWAGALVGARFGLAGRARRKAAFARETRAAFEELGPSFVKIGQMMSVRPDVFSPELVFELSRLRDSVAPLDAETVRGVIQEEFGRPPEELFEWFDARTGRLGLHRPGPPCPARPRSPSCLGRHAARRCRRGGQGPAPGRGGGGDGRPGAGAPPHSQGGCARGLPSTERRPAARRVRRFLPSRDRSPAGGQGGRPLRLRLPRRSPGAHPPGGVGEDHAPRAHHGVRGGLAALRAGRRPPRRGGRLRPGGARGHGLHAPGARPGPVPRRPAPGQPVCHAGRADSVPGFRDRGDADPEGAGGRGRDAGRPGLPRRRACPGEIGRPGDQGAGAQGGGRATGTGGADGSHAGDRATGGLAPGGGAELGPTCAISASVSGPSRSPWHRDPGWLRAAGEVSW